MAEPGVGSSKPAPPAPSFVNVVVVVDVHVDVDVDVGEKTCHIIQQIINRQNLTRST